MPINRYLLAKEKAFTNTMYRFFVKSRKEVQALLRKQDTQKDFNGDLNKLLEEIMLWAALIVSNKSKPVLVKWTKETIKINPNFAINWELRNDPAVSYLDHLVTIHSSNYLEWSIGHTTYTRITKLVNNWLSAWLSYTEIAKDIEKLDPIVFSKNRSKMIAVAELWTAYEQWKFMPMQDLKDKWEIVLKKWLTVNDEKVRPEHSKNQSDWYIPLDIPFSWTQTKVAPAPPNCRCSLIYKVI